MFDEVGPADMPAGSRSDYARALTTVGEFARAAKLLEDLPKDEPLPDWALGISVDIALKQGDIRGALGLLERLAEKHPEDFRVRAELARRLLEIGESDAARPHIDTLVGKNSLSPLELMDTAYLLKQLGRTLEATNQAYRSLRLAPQDPAIHRAFANLMIFDPPQIPLPTEVTPETFVRLVSDDGTERGYVICPEGPVDPLRNELSATDPAAKEYLGRRVGDIVTLNAGAWQEARWRVEEILPAVVHAFRDVIGHYQERFPSEPFFVAAFKVPEADSVRFVAPFISSLHAKKAATEEAFRLYRESTLPLGFVAGVLGVSVADVMAAAMMPDRSLGPLIVDWSDLAGQQESRDAARRATNVVITRSALETTIDLGLLDQIADTYTWVAPRSLLNVLNRELDRAEHQQANGLSFVIPSAAGIQLEELPAGDLRLEVKAARLRRLIAWLTDNARIDLRPLETIPASGSREDETRTAMGRDSHDSVRLAEHLKGTMFADDLGLRRYLPKGAPARSFSTTSLLQILVERGVLSGEVRDQMLLKLVDRTYTMIMPTESLLSMAFRQPERNRSDLVRVFGLVTMPPVDLAMAARLVVETLRTEIVAPLQVVDFESLVIIALEAMTVRWGVAPSANALSAAAATILVLLPRDADMVRRVAKAFIDSRR
ncbi:MAG: tetratricopeptide repeat protein [Thermoanaerobaculia bacterium]